MARNLYGCTSADFTLTESGRVVAGATATVWTARTGGTPATTVGLPASSRWNRSRAAQTSLLS